MVVDAVVAVVEIPGVYFDDEVVVAEDVEDAAVVVEDVAAVVVVEVRVVEQLAYVAAGLVLAVAAPVAVELVVRMDQAIPISQVVL